MNKVNRRNVLKRVVLAAGAGAAPSLLAEQTYEFGKVKVGSSQIDMSFPRKHQEMVDWAKDKKGDFLYLVGGSFVQNGRQISVEFGESNMVCELHQRTSIKNCLESGGLVFDRSDKVDFVVALTFKSGGLANSEQWTITS